jgi:hypothetical protein
MLRRLRMGLEAGTSEMLNEYRTRLYVNASEYAHAMTSAMWDCIARFKSSHNSAEGLTATRDGSRKRGRHENAKDQLARFHLIRKAIPPHGGKKACFQKLTAKNCSGGTYVCPRSVLPLCPEEVRHTGGRPDGSRDKLRLVAARLEMRTRRYTPWCGIPSSTMSLTTERG